jgi:protein ImuA
MSSKQEIIRDLRERIGAMEARDQAIMSYPLGIVEIDSALRYGGLAQGACHEIIGDASALGFILLALSSMVKKGPVIWCSPQEDFYTPGFAKFGIKDTDVIFVVTKDHKQALWATKTALTCNKISGVVLHASSMSLAEGRKLKLLAQQHMTTAIFWVKHNRAVLPTIASTRWHIGHAPSRGLPSRNGIESLGSPRLSIELTRNLYGLAPLTWTVDFDEHALRFHIVSPLRSSTSKNQTQRPAVRARQGSA